jgi:hypothetical protein
MSAQKSRHNYVTLGVMLLLAVSYHVTVYFWRPLSRAHKVEGILGILLGLFICSIPAANLLDMLYDLLGNRFQKQEGLRLVFWLALNILVLLVGWFIITLGATRFTRI